MVVPVGWIGGVLMTDFERAVEHGRYMEQLAEAVWSALRSNGCEKLSCNEICRLCDHVGYPTRFGTHVAHYGDVYVCLTRLEKRGAVCSLKVYNARLWWARG